MSRDNCPSAETLVRFVDADLSPESLGRIEEHLGGCSACALQVSMLRELIEDVAAVPEPTRLDLDSHVGEVMSRIQSQPQTRPRRNWAGWSVGFAAAAALALLFGRFVGDDVAQEFTPRGSGSESSSSRDVGVQLYSRDGELQALHPGSEIRSSTPLTVGGRNLGKRSAYLLLFAVDAADSVHWIAPEYTVEGSDPMAFELVPSQTERLSPTTVVFDDLAPGRLRVFAVITSKPTRVSQVEELALRELHAERLTKHFPQSEVRQIALQVRK